MPVTVALRIMGSSLCLNPAICPTPPRPALPCCAVLGLITPQAAVMQPHAASAGLPVVLAVLTLMAPLGGGLTYFVLKLYEKIEPWIFQAKAASEEVGGLPHSAHSGSCGAPMYPREACMRVVAVGFGLGWVGMHACWKL
jgi:hypothetical protein